MSDNIKEFAVKRITEIVNTSPENTLKAFDEKAWDTPILGFANGADPLFKEYKNIIGDFYWTPLEAMRLSYPEKSFDEKKLSIIVWVLPQTKATKADQRKELKLPSSRWVHSRHYGEKFNEYLRRQIRDEFIDSGVEAVAPAVREEFGYRQSDNAGLASNWSERHTAYAAGLGTFGLSDGFITEIGKAVRIGSVIINEEIQPDKRIFKTHTENCLYYADGSCGACMKRCPVDAISHKGHDKIICHDYIRGTTAPYAKTLLGEIQTPCGLCQVKIPCENRNPVKR